MKIAVNTRLLLPNKLEGIGWFTYETLKRITQQHREHEFIFLFDRPFDKQFIFSENIQSLVLSPKAIHPFLFYLWLEWVVPKALKTTGADIFLSPDGYLSLSTDVTSIAVIHDLNFEHYPQHLPLLNRWYYQYYFPKFAKKAKRIATVSEYSKQDITRCYNIAPDTIDVVYNGSNEMYHPISEEEKIKTRQKYTQGKPYFLFIGALHPRKNIAHLLQAFDKFTTTASSSIQFVIVGEKMWWNSEIEQSYQQMQFKEDVIFTGRLAPEELKKIIPSALAMLYVSFFEGFGIPVVEAMYCEVPVITSNVTSLPEIAGDAALFTDPFSVDSITEAMRKIAFNENLRMDLIAKGRKQREKFSWQNSAERLWGCIEKAVSIN